MRIVVKIAGALLESAETVRLIAQQIAEVTRAGHEVLMLHGGGKILTSTMERLGLEARFVNGLRVSNPAVRDAALMVLAGLVNKRLVAALASAGQPAVGICGGDGNTFLAEKMSLGDTDLGFVGYLIGCDVTLLELLWANGIVPVAASIAPGRDGEYYNINADHMAAACAEFCHAERLIYLTDVAGVLDGETVLPRISARDLEALVRTRKVTGGMVLKLEACRRALLAGVPLCGIVGGAQPGALADAVFGSAPEACARGTRVEAAAWRSGPARSESEGFVPAAQKAHSKRVPGTECRDSVRFGRNKILGEGIPWRKK